LRNLNCFQDIMFNFIPNGDYWLFLALKNMHVSLFPHFPNDRA
jgi:hypothetical protein